MVEVVTSSGSLRVETEDGKVVLRMVLNDETKAATGLDTFEVLMPPEQALTLAQRIMHVSFEASRG